MFYSVFSLLSPLFFFLLFSFLVSLLCSLSLSLKSMTLSQPRSAATQFVEVWIEDSVVLVGWWLWVCGLRLWWCGFVFWVSGCAVVVGLRLWVGGCVVVVGLRFAMCGFVFWVGVVVCGCGGCWRGWSIWEWVCCAFWVQDWWWLLAWDGWEFWVALWLPAWDSWEFWVAMVATGVGRLGSHGCGSVRVSGFIDFDGNKIVK